MLNIYKAAFKLGPVNQFMLDLNAKYLLKLEAQGVKVKKGDQTSSPILKWFYNIAKKELALIRNSAVYGEDLVRMFSV